VGAGLPANAKSDTYADLIKTPLATYRLSVYLRSEKSDKVTTFQKIENHTFIPTENPYLHQHNFFPLQKLKVSFLKTFKTILIIFTSPPPRQKTFTS
jgi:hypothetical protein